MEGWQTENRGFVLGKDIAKAASPPQRNRTSNQLKPQKTLSNRLRASKRFKGAQGKVLRAVRVQRAMMGVQRTRQNARNNWQRGVNKMATVMGFKRLGIDAVQRRKRSIFGNLMTGAIIDDSSMPRVSLHDLNEAEQKLSQQNRRGSAISSMVFSQRPAAAPSPLRRPASTTRSSSPKTIVPEVAPLIVQRDGKATAESVAKQMKRQELKKKMKGAVGKVQKFVRTVRLSYSDTFSGKNKVSLTELLGRLRKHYDPDGIHADPHDGQHAFYTDLALLQRESLKHDTRVRRILDFIWSATDKDGSGTIDKEEYMVMCRKVYRAIVDDTNSPEAEAEIRKIAEEDWDVDRQGHDHLDYERFTRAWFQLADHWTHDLSADSYETFLSNIFTSLTERDKNGNIVWRDDRDIHHYDPEATEEEQNTLVEAGFQDIIVEVKKKKKKKRNTYMDADAMEKYRQRMANKKKKSRGGNVIVVQEGEFQRNTKLAKISSRNGLYIGSVVPPPEDFDDVHTHANVRQSAFMRIAIEGGPGVYNRGFNSDAESVARMATSFTDAYPRKLRNSLQASSAAFVSSALSEDAKASAAHLLQQLWCSSPIGGSGRPAGSPGGPSGWLTHFSRAGDGSEAEASIEQSMREQTGVGGGYMAGGDGYDNDNHATPVRVRPHTAHSKRRSHQQSRGGQPSSLHRPQSAPAVRIGRKNTEKSSNGVVIRSTNEHVEHDARNGSIETSNKLENNGAKLEVRKTKTLQKTRSSNLIGNENSGVGGISGISGISGINGISGISGINGINGVTASGSIDSTVGNNVVRSENSDAETLRVRKNKKNRKNKSNTSLARPSSAVGTRTKRDDKVRRNKRLKRPRSATGRTRLGRRRQHSSLKHADTPETDVPPELTMKTRRRPKSAHSRLRKNRKTLDGSHMFNTISNSEVEKQEEMILSQGVLQAKQHKSKKRLAAKKKKKKLKKLVPKVTLLRLNETCTKDDVAGVLAAMGASVSRSDICMTQLKKTGLKKARIVFRSFVEFKTAVKMLTIVQRSVDVRGNTGIFESKVSAAEETAPKKVNAISKIKVPKIMQ